MGAGANVDFVQRMFGPATAAMTLDLYGHLLDDDLSGVAEALGKPTEAGANICSNATQGAVAQLVRAADS